LEIPPKGAPFGNPRLCPKKLKALRKKSKALPKKPKAVLDVDAFIQKWDFKGPAPLMAAGQSPVGLQGQRPCTPFVLS
jgi:hypothetical protein